MKEIKFRAWDKYNNCWYYLYLNQMWRQQDLEFYNNLSTRGEKLYQYTGLKDKNGKEIYEGDILQYQGFNKDVVEWVECDAGFSTRDYMPTLVDACNWNKCKIIGNIYENKELLK